MKLIERYIFGRVFAFTFSALLVVTGILLTTQLLHHVNLVTGSAEAARSFLIVALTLTPTIALLVVPVALLIGILRTLNTMNTDSELAVLEAAGCAPSTTVRPIVALAALTTLASLLMAHTVEPWSNRKLQDALTAASADLIRRAVQSGSFVTLGSDLFVQIGTELPSGEFGRVVIVDGRDADTQVIYYAKRGAITDNEGVTLFVLADGEIHRRNNHNRSVSIISFATTALDFSQFLRSDGGRGYRAEELTTAYLLSPEPNDPLFVDRPSNIRREIHRRFSEWLYPLAFGLIAAYFGGKARTSRQEQPLQIVLAVLIALVLRGIGFLTVGGSGESQVLAILSYAVPLGSIVVFGGLIVGSMSLRIPKRAIEGVDAFGSAIAAAVGQGLRLARRGGGPRS